MHLNWMDSEGYSPYETPSPEDARGGRAERPHGLMLRARDAMSAPVTTLAETATVADAWALFLCHGFRHLPVVSADHSLVGLLSDRDLLRQGPDPVNAPPGHEVRADTTPLCELMSTRLLTASPEAPIHELAHAMVHERISCLPIVGKDGLEGILTTTDLLRCIVANSLFDPRG